MSYFYVICPVGVDPSFPEKRSVLKELGEAHGTEPFFPLEHHSEFSVRSTANDMRDAEFVLADLSLERPSCYFELGVAQALGADVVLIAVTGTPVHQVGDTRPVSFYSDLVQYRFQVSQILGSRLALPRG